jgi:hypothetical protein
MGVFFHVSLATPLSSSFLRCLLLSLKYRRWAAGLYYALGRSVPPATACCSGLGLNCGLGGPDAALGEAGPSLQRVARGRALPGHCALRRCRDDSCLLTSPAPRSGR